MCVCVCGGGGGGGGGADDKFVILLVKKGYGLVSAFSQPYRTRPDGWLHADTRPYPFFTSRITNSINYLR